MTRPYDLELIKKAESIASEMNLVLKKGVYLAGTDLHTRRLRNTDISVLQVLTLWVCPLFRR